MKPHRFAGLLPSGKFKTPTGKYIKPLVYSDVDLAGGLAGKYIHPKDISAHVDTVARTRGVPREVARAQVAAATPGGIASMGRAESGGLIGISPRTAAGGPDHAAGFGSSDRFRRSVLQHEIVHSIRSQKRGGPPKGVIPLLGEELAAYRAAQLGRGGARSRSLPQTAKANQVRGEIAAVGLWNSFNSGRKSLGIPAWKLFETNFDSTQGDWDIRDARGRSARVYAPGAGKRDRREKRWYERASFLKKAALAGALIAGGGVAYGLRQRGIAKKASAPKPTTAPADPRAHLPEDLRTRSVDYLKKEGFLLAARVRPTEFRRGDYVLPVLAKRGLLGSDTKTRHRVLGAVRAPGPATQLIRDRLAKALRTKVRGLPFG